MLTANHTIIDEVRLQLGDAYSKCFTQEEYEAIVEDCIVSDVRVTLQLSQFVPALFKTQTKYRLYKASFAVDPAFLTTGVVEGDFLYDFNEYNLTYKPTSTETRTQIIVQGVSVDFPEIMLKTLRALSTDAVKMAMAIDADGDDIDREQHYRHLSIMAQQWRGIVGI